MCVCICVCVCIDILFLCEKYKETLIFHKTIGVAYEM